MKTEEKLLEIFENLFNPINNKDFGLYWNVSNNKSKPLANAEELLKYVRKESKEGSFINRYANLLVDLILEGCIYLDFDLTKKEYLKQEESNTLKTLEELAEKILEPDVKNYDSLKQIQQKYKKDYSIDNGFIKGYNSFIDSLGVTNSETLAKLVRVKEKEEVAKLKSEKEVQQYYKNKFEKGYLKKPFEEATRTAKYFNHIGVKTVLNWSGSKGLALRIPITNVDFKGTELEDNPENVKLFLKALANLIETKLLEKPIGTSNLDYNIFCKGMQRIPTSKHNKTKLYANFIEPSLDYLEAIDYLEAEVPVYIPEVIDSEENTKILMESDIYKATINKAVEDSTIKTYDSEIGTVAYNFKSKDHEELKKNILNIYPESLNFFPYKVIHVLKRSGFTKEEVEAIFHDVEPNPTEYNKNIKGNIKYAFENPNAKICGLKNLIEWIREKYPNNEKASVIEYFSKNFKYYEKPTETTLEDTLIISDKEYNLKTVKTSKKELYVLPNFTEEEYSIQINKEKKLLLFKNENKLIANLKLKNAEGLVPSSKDKFKKFKGIIEKKVKIEPDVIEEAITELDNYLTYLEDLKEEEANEESVEEEINEEPIEDSKFIKFGETEEGFYSQVNFDKNKGIYYNYYVKTAEGYDTKRKPIANVIINEITIVLDSLDILESVYNVTYTNLTFNKEVTVEYLTKKQLTEEFIKANVFYISTKESVETVLNAFIIDGTKENRILTKTEAYLEGYYYINNKVVSNTKLNNIKKYTAEDVAEAILLLNEIMIDRTEEGKANDSAVYRFMLWNPFSYILKQLGYSKAIYSLILIGLSQTNKTGATNIGRLFYLHNEEETSGSTVSVLGSKIGENSFLKVFDECSHLFKLPEALNVMKRLIYEKTARATKDRNDNKKIDVFNAIGLAMFILNERIDFKDFITNRYKIIDYTSKSFIDNDSIAEFNKKYVPEAEDTKLKKLAIIGKVFSEKLIAIIENPTDRNKLFNIEELTIEILKEIAEETSGATGKPIDFLPEMYETTEASTKYNYDLSKEIRKLLNSEFKRLNKARDNQYVPRHFIDSAINNDFDFITYNRHRTDKTNDRHFIIGYSTLTKYVNSNIEEAVEIETILDSLGLTEVLEKKMKEENYKKSFSEYIKRPIKIISEDSKKPKVIKGFTLTVEELANNLFSFNLDFDKEEVEDSLKKEK